MDIVCTDESSDGLIERQIVEAAGLTFAFQPCRAPAELVEASRGARALLTGLLPLPGDLLRRRPELKLIVTCSTGWDHIKIRSWELWAWGGLAPGWPSEPKLSACG